jgi:hypothetical protein
MPGIPLYPRDFRDDINQIKRDVKDAWTSANSRQPYTKIAASNIVISEGALDVKDGDGDTQVLVGKLTNGNYGIAAINDADELVELDTLAFGIRADNVSLFETTSSTSYTDLATVGPSVTVTIGTSGRAKLTLSASVQLTVPKVPANFIKAYGAYMSYVTTGTETRSGGDPSAVSIEWSVDTSSSGESSAAYTIQQQMSRVNYLHDLTPGVYVVTAKYKAFGLATNVEFGHRDLIVEPF